MATMIHVVGDNTPAKTLIAARVRQAIELFLSAGVGRVELACNERRELLVDQLSRLPRQQLLADRGLPHTTVAQALEELTPPFQLVEPQAVVIDLAHDEYGPNPQTAMAAHPGDGIMCVFTSAIDTVHLRDLYGGMPLAEITFHEMLHLCGETQYDGVIRYNWAGIDSVKEVLGI